MVEPAQYSLYDNECKKNVSSLLNEFAKELKNISGKCMDIGSGPGDITKEILLPFLDSNATIIGIDIMEKMVKYANETYGDGKRLKFEVLDIQTKSLPEKYISKFDHIFSFHTLQWCNDIRQIFKNIYCMLRPGKTMLILSIGHHRMLFEPLKVIMQDVRYASYMKDKSKYTGFHDSVQPDKELKEILENIGFQVQHCSHREINSFLSAKKFVSMVISQHSFAFLEQLPHNLRIEFQSEYTRICKEIQDNEYKSKQTNDELHDDKKKKDPFNYTVLVVYAQKNVL